MKPQEEESWKLEGKRRFQDLTDRGIPHWKAAAILEENIIERSADSLTPQDEALLLGINEALGAAL
jgi:hypothetical protein